MLTYILVGIAVIVVAVLVAAATKPNVFRLARSAEITAAPDKIYPFIADFHKWSAWSPWEKLDPALSRTYSGAESGKGAVYAWEGNRQVGAGRMEITEATASSRVALDIDFLRPFKNSNKILFTLEPAGALTRVTWSMEGPMSFMAKVMHNFFNMDKMVGKDFDKGLAAMRAAAEKA